MKWLSSKVIFIALLVVVSIILVLPPIMYDYIYPTLGDDTVEHLNYFQDMGNREPLYWGQYITGRLMNWLPYGMTTSFLWFHFIVLVAIFWVIGWSVVYCSNYTTGIIAVLFVLGASQVLNLFYSGQIFDLINIGIILPISLVCLHRIDKESYWKFGLVITLSIFMVFHANGKYIYALLPMIVAYEMFRPNLANKWKVAGNRIVVYSGFLGVVLVVLRSFDVGQPDPIRLWFDATILLTLACSILLGVYVKGKPQVLAVVVLVVCALVGQNMIYWFNNNSAIREVDKEAMATLNALPGNTYEASPEIQEKIYGLFVNKELVVNQQADYAIKRSAPMTPRSDSDNPYFDNGYRYIAGSYSLVIEYDTGEIDKNGENIVVALYGRNNE